MEVDRKIKQLKQIMELMKQYQVDNVEIDGIKVSKLYHDIPQPQLEQPEINDEDAMFWSGE